MMLRELDLWISVCCLVCLVAAGQSINCPDKCGDIDIKFPFGTARGCGDPEHQLSCNGPYSLTLKQGDIVVNVVSINYTLENHYMIINTTANPSSYLNDKCDLVLNSDAYDLTEEEIFVCALSNPQAPFPDFVPVPQTGCFYKKGIQIPLPWPFELGGFGIECYNYTNSSRPPRDGSYSPFGLTYASVPWKVSLDRVDDCSRCNNNGDICGYNIANNESQCYTAAPAPAGAPGLLSRAPSRSRKTVIGAVAGASGGALLLIFCLGGCYIFNWRQQIQLQKGLYTSTELKIARTECEDALKIVSGLSTSDAYHKYGSTLFTLGELNEATDFFAEFNLLGRGGFNAVYKGKLHSDGRFVAVKKLKTSNDQGKSQFQNEIRILSQVKHPHLLQLHGCCTEEDEFLLVYDFVPNGTLSDHLFKRRGSPFMEWNKRLIIATQTAEALAWLHTKLNPPVYHRDVKSSNILIDENFHAKVGDFGISRLVPSLDLTHISTAPMGTPGYIDPEYYQNHQLSDKSDVYSFGVVLMEIVSSQRAVDLSRDTTEICLADLALSRIESGELERLVDPGLGTECDPVMKQMVEAVAALGFRCLAASKKDRPCMSEVSLKLKEISEMNYN